MRNSFFITLLMSVIGFILTSCTQQNSSISESSSGTADSIITVCLQPYNGFPKKQLQQLQTDMQHCLDTLIPEKKFNVILLDERPFPKFSYYKPRNRYRADSIICYQKTFNSPDYVMGIADKDISTSIHGAADFGILGLSFRPGRSAVVSTFRVKNKKLFYKVAIHELLHCLGLPHCGEKDRSCYICDADKTPKLEKQTRICPLCRKKLLETKAFK